MAETGSPLAKPSLWVFTCARLGFWAEVTSKSWHGARAKAAAMCSESTGQYVDQFELDCIVNPTVSVHVEESREERAG